MRLSAAAAVKKAAFAPYKMFFCLLILFGAVAASVFFKFKEPGPTQILSNQIPQKERFDNARAREYRQIFEIIKKRQIEYETPSAAIGAEIFSAPRDLKQ